MPKVPIHPTIQGEDGSAQGKASGRTDATEPGRNVTTSGAPVKSHEPNPDTQVAEVMASAAERRYQHEKAALPPGRSIVANLDEFQAIADPVEAMVTATSEADARWMEDNGWPLPEELRIPGNPDVACRQVKDWSTLKDDNLCAYALFHGGSEQNVDALFEVARQGSSFAARLRLLRELQLPPRERNSMVISQMILAGLLAGDSGIRHMAPAGTILNFSVNEIASMQRAISITAENARWTGRPMSFRSRPQPMIVVGTDEQGRVVPMPPRDQ